MKDADILEKVYMFAFVALIMLVGIYPAILTDVIKLGISPIVRLIRWVKEGVRNFES